MIPLMVQPVTSAHVPVDSHVTVVALMVPSYPSAQDTEDVSPYVLPVVSEYVYPGLTGGPQSIN